MKDIEVEHSCKIYLADGDHFQIGPDPDGLGLVHLSLIEFWGDEKVIKSISIPPDYVMAVAHALIDNARINGIIP